MHSHFDISPSNPSSTPAASNLTDPALGLLREILDVQKQILAQLQAQASAQDNGARWRSLLERWQQEFPELPRACRTALPILERAYGSIVAGLVDELEQNGDEALDNDFALQDFLDRYGIRLGQLGNIMNLVGPLAEASSRNESS